MPAYVIVQNTIKDEAQYQKYVQAVVPFIGSFGGRLVARRAKVEVLERRTRSAARRHVRVS